MTSSRYLWEPPDQTKFAFGIGAAIRGPHRRDPTVPAECHRCWSGALAPCMRFARSSKGSYRERTEECRHAPAKRKAPDLAGINRGANACFLGPEQGVRRENANGLRFLRQRFAPSKLMLLPNPETSTYCAISPSPEPPSGVISSLVSSVELLVRRISTVGSHYHLCMW
jgi:hypothetical protein